MVLKQMKSRIHTKAFNNKIRIFLQLSPAGSKNASFALQSRSNIKVGAVLTRTRSIHFLLNVKQANPTKLGKKVL